MKRVVKREGKGNIGIEEVETPVPSPTEVLIKTKASLISRGSEIYRRYLHEEVIDPAIMGYSVAGVIADVGAEVDEFRTGDRVAVLAPHAEYVVAEVKKPQYHPSVVALPEGLSFEEGTFWPLSTSSVCWAWATAIQPGDTVVILGQGLVGSLMLQALRPWGAARIVAVDALPLRCDMAKQLGADMVVNCTQGDPVQVVREATGGKGADIVIEAVGGAGGSRAFQQALDMTCVGGRIVVIGLYHGEPLPLDASKVMSQQIVGANQFINQRSHASRIALRMLSTRFVRVVEMITHRFSFTQAKEAFDLLYERPGETLGVILLWE
jgi:threonine dehydrogenase-like Zn-dependent dehydrogenase